MHIMMNGGVMLLLGLLGEPRLQFWVTRVLSAFSYAPIVRQLIWQQLSQSMDGMRKLLALVDTAQSFEDPYWHGTALSAATAVAFLRMVSTVPAQQMLDGGEVDDALRRFCDRDPCFQMYVVG